MTTPTPAALRAATVIAQQLSWQAIDLTKLALLIDQQTGLPELVEAAHMGAKWMKWWLEQMECDCEVAHTCGWTDRQKELQQIEAALNKAEKGME